MTEMTPCCFLLLKNSKSCYAFGLQLIPKSFMREHNLGKKHTRFFRDPSGKLWPVNIIHSCNRSDFGSGWHDFRVGNNLGEGDRCIFEFMEGDEIQVHIIRDEK